MIPSKFLTVLLCALLVAQIPACLASDSLSSVAQRRTLSQRRFLDDYADPYADLYDYKDFPTDDSPDDGSALIIKGITDDDPDGDGSKNVSISDSRANGLLPLGTHGGRVPYPTTDSPPPSTDNGTDSGRGVEGVADRDVWWRGNSSTNGTAAPPSAAPPSASDGDETGNSTTGENQQKQEQSTSPSSTSPPSSSSSGSSSSGGQSGFSINGLPEGASIAIVVSCCLAGVLLILGALLMWRTYFVGRVVPSVPDHKGKAIMIEDDDDVPGSPSSIRTA